MMLTSHDILIDAVQMVPDMLVRWDDAAGAYRTVDVRMGGGASDPIPDVRDIAYIVGRWIADDGGRIPADLRRISVGGAAEIASRPLHLRPGYDSRGGQDSFADPLPPRSRR